jgi:hypothetical protein
MLQMLEGELFYLYARLEITREDSDDAANEHVGIPPLQHKQKLGSKVYTTHNTDLEFLLTFTS